MIVIKREVKSLLRVTNCKSREANSVRYIHIQIIPSLVERLLFN